MIYVDVYCLIPKLHLAVSNIEFQIKIDPSSFEIFNRGHISHKNPRK